MTNWKSVAALSEVPVGSVKAFDLGFDTVAIAHTDEGIFAISDVCSHAEVSLSEGELEGCMLECWMHGSAFDVRTGVPSGPPAVRPVATYSVRVVGEADLATIEVEIGK
jgi:3-phenylpropionate/trans-cinnamate dioxygenase ferredoxin component